MTRNMGTNAARLAVAAGICFAASVSAAPALALELDDAEAPVVEQSAGLFAEEVFAAAEADAGPDDEVVVSDEAAPEPAAPTTTVDDQAPDGPDDRGEEGASAAVAEGDAAEGSVETASNPDVVSDDAADDVSDPEPEPTDPVDPEPSLVAGWNHVDGLWYWCDASSNAVRTGWLVTDVATDGSTSGGYQRYWLNSDGSLAVDSLIDKDEAGWWAYATANGSVVRNGSYRAGDLIYLADNDGRLLNDGWNVTGAFTAGALQRYYVDPASHACVAGYSNDGWAHYTTDKGYVARGAFEDAGATHYADNNGRLAASSWVVTSDLGQGLQRYWFDADGALAIDRLVTPEEGAGYYALATAKGYALRGAWDTGAGRVYIADNDGRLAEGAADCWLVTGAYTNGALQRYYIDPETHAARSGFFTVNGASYFGKAGTGAILRGKMAWDSHVLLADNDGKMCATSGWVVTDLYDGHPERYWMESVSAGGTYLGAKTGFFKADDKSYYGYSGAGYVLRGSMRSSSGLKYIADNDGVIDQASYIVDIARKTPSPGGGLCSEWVDNVFEQAGFERAGGDACDDYWWFGKSSDLTELKKGMVIAVPSHTHTYLGGIYGHVCIYIGDGKIMDNVGYIRTTTLSYWLDYYSTTYTPKWGWYNGIELVS